MKIMRVLSLIVLSLIAAIPVSRALAQGREGAFIPTITSGPSGGETVSLLEGNIYSVAKNYYPKITTDYWGNVDQYAPKSVTIEWDCKEKPLYYTLKLAINPELTDAQSFVTFDKEITLDTLYAGYHYYYQVIATYEEKTVKSVIFDFETEALPRTIYVEGVSNTRDIGGYYTTDGRYRVKQGMAYRGAAIDALTAVGREDMLQKFGIKTEIELRGTAGGKSTLDENINFVGVSAPYYAMEGSGDSQTGIDASAYQDALRAEIRAFANPDNYPIYFHCQIGRDRTGTLAFLINALLGVGIEDLQLDYELSFLSTAGYTGVPPKNFMDGALKRLQTYLEGYQKGGTLQQNTEQFMLDLGITPDEIASIKAILLEEVQ